ncbi:MAG: thiamine pyrophosphate-binding protein [Anaerolineales bacterium]|nr:thiamine pyrophosphate-binding protein [Anaerolineales bacterium]
MAKSGGQLVAQYMVKEGISYVFGISGHGVLGFLDACADLQDRIKMVMVRHEEVAGFMADGYYRLSHKPAATITSSGAGSVNLLISLAEALSNSVPLLSITGDVATTQFNSGALQETYRQRECDYPSVVRHYVKQTFQVNRVDMLPKVLVQAFKTMLSGRPGPVNIDVPYDMFVETAKVDIHAPDQWTQSIDSRVQGNPAAVEQAIDLLLSAERPLILAGHGVLLAEGWDELGQLSSQLRIPVITSGMGKGLIPENDPMALGAAGAFGPYPANEAARSADVILALGCRFSDLHTSSWLPGYTYNIPPTRLIHVDIDPNEIGRNYPVAVGIVGDCKMVLRQILSSIKGKTSPDYSAWLAEVEKAQADWEEFMEPRRISDKSPIQVERVFYEMRKALSADASIFVDAGNTGGWAVQQWQALQPYAMQVAGGFNSMGWAAGAVMGGKLAAPDRPCVCVCGDGSFSMVPHVMATAVEYDIPAIWVVLNDFAWGAIRGLQKGYFNEKVYGTSFVRHKDGKPYNPDFAMWARACGAEGEQVKQPEDLAPALERAVKSGRPYLVDILIDPDEGVPFTGTWQMPPVLQGEPVFGKRKLV